MMSEHMKKEIERIIRYMVVGISMLFAACNKDADVADVDNGSRQEVILHTYFSPFYEANMMTTRSLPDGYMRYSELYPSTQSDYASIRIALAQDAVASPYYYNISFRDGQWKASMDIKDQTYYIYGFMPSELAGGLTLAKKDGSYANGTTMTINNLSVLTSADVCVIVGVKRADEATNIEEAGIQLGQFGIHGSETRNYLYLLLKHIYAGLHFKAHIDSEYAKLHTIKVKRMTLTTVEEISEAINLTVSLTANDMGADPCGEITYTPQGASTYASTILYQSDEGFELPVQSPTSFLGCFAPGRCSKFVLETLYDVYDRKGNLIRKDCTATNKIDAENLGVSKDINELNAGEIYTIDLKVQPTYLYVLSDPDLDNPTITIE